MSKNTNNVKPYRYPGADKSNPYAGGVRRGRGSCDSMEQTLRRVRARKANRAKR